MSIYPYVCIFRIGEFSIVENTNTFYQLKFITRTIKTKQTQSLYIHEWHLFTYIGGTFGTPLLAAPHTVPHNKIPKWIDVEAEINKFTWRKRFAPYLRSLFKSHQCQCFDEFFQTRCALERKLRHTANSTINFANV